MKPGDLVRLRETYRTSSAYPDEFIIGNLDMSSYGFPIPQGSVCIVVRVIDHESHPDDVKLHVMVPDGRVGWVYPEDCEVISEDS